MAQKTKTFPQNKGKGFLLNKKGGSVIPSYFLI